MARIDALNPFNLMKYSNKPVCTEPDLRTPIQINPRIIPFEMVTPDGFKIVLLRILQPHMMQRDIKLLVPRIAST